MSRERYLIVGLGKTGTTAVAMTLANTLKIADVLLEPKDLTTIERANAYQRLMRELALTLRLYRVLKDLPVGWGAELGMRS